MKKLSLGNLCDKYTHEASIYTLKNRQAKRGCPIDLTKIDEKSEAV